MTLPTGAISMSQVAAELGISQTGLSLNHSWVRALAGQNSGPVSMSNLQGQTAQPNWNGTPDGSTNVMNMSVPFFRGTAVQVDPQLISHGSTLLTFSAAPNWSGNIILKNNSTGASTLLNKQNATTWSTAGSVGGILRPAVTDNYSLIPSS